MASFFKRFVTVENLSVGIIFGILVLLLLISGFFSGSEIGMMSLNRYRLRHLVRQKHRAALRVAQLLDRPDRLLSVILIGNTFANTLARKLRERFPDRPDLTVSAMAYGVSRPPPVAAVTKSGEVRWTVMEWTSG